MKRLMDNQSLESLSRQNQFGYFDDEAREYVITNPRTPYPWINYLGYRDFLGMISNTAGGYAFYRDAKLRRLTRYRYNSLPADNTGRYFYVVDGDSVWSPSWKPVKTELDSYSCRHGMGYTRIEGAKDGLKASCLYFVPLGCTAEIHQVALHNTTRHVKRIKLFSYAEWCLWNAADDASNFQRNFSTGEVEVDGSVIYHKTEYRERRNHYGFYAVNCPIDGYDTDRASFLGPHNGTDAPEAVFVRGQAGNSKAYGWSPIASHYIEIELQPWERANFVFMLGYGENPEDGKWDDQGQMVKTTAQELIARFSDVDAVDAAFQELRTHWDNLLSCFSVKSGEKRLDRLVNIWNQYQCVVTFNLSRSASLFESGVSRGIGFRDSNQDLLGAVHIMPERARARILDLASTQFSDGSAYHQYQPLTKQGNADIGGGFNDDPLWLILSTCAYIKETGDYSILDEPTPYDDKPDSDATLFDHLQASFNHVIENLGPHKLPLIGRADWNDCLNLNCFSTNPDESFQTTTIETTGSAESLMIAGLFVWCGQDYVALCKQLGKDDEASRADGHLQAMKKAVMEHGWDGRWFLRAYDHDGNKVGSSECKEGQIFVESQGWCVMAGIGREADHAERAMDSVKAFLDCEHGVVVLYPAYSKYYKELGEISSYPQGYKENGAVFCHTNPWIVIAETTLGRGNNAFSYFCKTAPTYREHIAALHKTEPFVYPQMIAGKEAHKPGEAKNSWLTGTAAWAFYAASQFILGVRPDWDGLELDPCIPVEWKGFEVTRQFRGGTLEIKVENPGHVSRGVKLIEVNGKAIDGQIVPPPPKGKTQKVRVVMG